MITPKAGSTLAILVNRLESSKICGPGLFTRELKNKDVTIFPSNYFYPISWFDLNIDNIDYNAHENSYMFQYGGTTNNLQSLTDINFYWINMDRSIERRKDMYYFFSKNLIYNYRINAYDDNKINEYNDLNYSSFNNISKYEYCCTFSHLKAIKTSYENNDKISIICEDDLCIDYKKKWKYNLEDIIKNAPNDWEIIKVNYNKNNLNCFMEWNENNKSQLFYIINNKGMKKILDKFFIKNKFVLENKLYHSIFKIVKTYDYNLSNNVENIMIVAHPDDESIFGGHVINNNWKIICVTNGNNEIRRTEFENVMNMSGALYEIWDFKDHRHYNFGGKEDILSNKLNRIH